MTTFTMQPTPDQIDEQIQLERNQIRQGLKRLQDNTVKLENQNYGSATKPNGIFIRY